MLAASTGLGTQASNRPTRSAARGPSSRLKRRRRSCACWLPASLISTLREKLAAAGMPPEIAAARLATDRPISRAARRRVDRPDAPAIPPPRAGLIAAEQADQRGAGQHRGPFRSSRGSVKTSASGGNRRHAAGPADPCAPRDADADEQHRQRRDPGDEALRQPPHHDQRQQRHDPEQRRDAAPVEAGPTASATAPAACRRSPSSRSAPALGWRRWRSSRPDLESVQHRHRQQRGQRVQAQQRRRAEEQADLGGQHQRGLAGLTPAGAACSVCMIISASTVTGLMLRKGWNPAPRRTTAAAGSREAHLRRQPREHRVGQALRDRDADHHGGDEIVVAQGVAQIGRKAARRAASAWGRPQEQRAAV